jgi:hypothetical protein
MESVIRRNVGTFMTTQNPRMGANATAFHTNAKRVEDRKG